MSGGRRTLAIAGTALAIVVVLVAGLVASRWRGGPGIAVGDTLYEIHRTDGAGVPGDPERPVFVLVLGHDARPGETTSRADAIHLVGVNAARRAATIVNIPRDTYVDIPGFGRDKINAAFAYGGPDLAAATVSALAGVAIPYVISTGFAGLTAMVDELGGVALDIPVAMNDPKSGAVFAPGPARLGGAQALAFSRNRSLPGGDFARTENQGRLILAALAELRARDASPAARLGQLATLLRHGRVDGAGLGDLYRLGELALSLDPAKVANVTLPGRGGRVGAASVVLLEPSAGALLADVAVDGVLDGG